MDLDILILILGVVAVVVFVFGVMLVISGTRSGPDAKQVMPKDEFQNVQKELESTRESEEQLKQQLDKLAVDLDRTRDELKEAATQGKDLQELKQKESDYLRDIETLTKNLDFLRSKADSQAQESIEVISSLKNNNDALVQEVEAARDKIDPQQLENLIAEKSALQEKIEENMKNMELLQSQLDKIQNLSETLREESEQKVIKIQDENIRLRGGIKQIVDKISEVESEISRAIQQSEQQLNEAHKKIDDLSQEGSKLSEQKQGNESRIKEMEQNLIALNEKLSAQPSVSNVPSASELSVEPAAGEQSWIEERKVVERSLRNLREINARLMERERALQFELTKSRAQALGLEKVCENFKKQLEGES